MKIRNKKTGGVVEIPKGMEDQMKQHLSQGGDPMELLGNKLDMAKHGIYINPKNTGKFNATKKATGKTTEELTHSKNPVTKKRAIFAQNAAKWNKKEEGGELYDIKAPYVYSYSHGGYVPMAKYGNPQQLQKGNISVPEITGANNYQGMPGIGAPNYSQEFNNLTSFNPYQQYEINQPLQKGNISVPKITGAPNYKQELPNYDIHPWDFYNPQTGKLNKKGKQSQNKEQSIAPIIPNMYSNNIYFARANEALREGIENLSGERSNKEFNGMSSTGDMSNQSNFNLNNPYTGSKYGGMMQDGGGVNQNWSGSGWSKAAAGLDFLKAGINTAKGFTDIAGSMYQNNAVAGIESEQRRANLMGQYQNTPPQFSNNWHGRNSLEGVYTQVKYGGMMQNGGDMGQQSNGIPSKFTGDRHYDGGIDINTEIPSQNANDMKKGVKKNLNVEGGEYYVPGKQNGGQANNDVILSDRKNVGIGGMSPSEILEEESKKIKINGDTAELGISSNKFNKGITKGEDFRADNVKFLSPTLAEQTASTVKLLSAPITAGMQELAQNIYIQQELTKQSKGMDNDLDSIMQSNQQPMAKYGAQIPDDMNYYDTGKMFMANGGKLLKAQTGFNYNIQPNKNKLDPTYSKMKKQKTPTGVEYEPLTAKDIADWKSIETNLNLAHPNGIPFTDNAQGYYGNIKDKQQLVNLGYQEQYYDDMLETPQGRAELAKVWQDKGKTLKGIKLPVKTDDLTSLNDEELYDKLNSLRPAYLDSFPKVRKGTKYYNPNPKSIIQKQTKEEKPSDVVNPIKGDFSSIKSRNTLQQMPSFNMYIPNEYAAKPITSYDVNPYFQQPHTISPYINDIQRAQYAFTANRGTSGTELANAANMFGQGLDQYGKRFYDASVYNAGAKTQADAQNAQAAYQAAIGNRGNQWQTESAQNQRDAAMQGQLELDKNPYLKMMADKDYEQRMGIAAKNIYNQDYIDPWKYTEVSSNDSESVKKAKEDLKKALYFQDKKKYEPDSVKFGGKVNKLNTKKFKKKK
jgi:hypothetical protein